MIIKKAVHTDLYIIRSITLETINAIYPRYYPTGAVNFFIAHHSAENIAADIALGNVFIMLAGENPVGTVTIKSNEILRLFVLPEHQRNGYGRALLEFSEKKILENYQTISLSASLPAKEIYLKRGYKETESHAILTENGDYLCYDVMEKVASQGDKNMNSNEYDSEFCNVRYIEKDNVIFLTWKKFARIDDYRKPALFALDLLKKFPKSNFIVDARNGFEDDEEDVKWGFSELLPSMAKTDCKYVIFIMQNQSEIQDEMDMWTIEFGKYFAVAKATSFEDAINKIHNRILVNVRYLVKPGKRDEFLEKVNDQGIIKGSRAEPGNYQYEYFRPADSENVLFLMEMWVSREALAAHGKTEHYRRLQGLKKEYVTDVTIEKYSINAIL